MIGSFRHLSLEYLMQAELRPGSPRSCAELMDAFVTLLIIKKRQPGHGTFRIGCDLFENVAEMRDHGGHGLRQKQVRVVLQNAREPITGLSHQEFQIKFGSSSINAERAYL